MDKNEFEEDYVKRSRITLEEYHKQFVSLPCACGSDGCCGWAAVCNNELSIRIHNELYASKQTEV